MYSLSESQHAAGNRTGSFGQLAEAYHSGSGTITDLVGAYGFADNQSSIGGNATRVSAIAANAYQSGNSSTAEMSGLRLFSNGKAGGTVQNNYGLKIDDQGIGDSNWAIKTGLGKVEFGGPVSTPQLNQVRFADQFAGADAGAKITAAIADLPSTGGTVDARGLEGPQTVSSDVFTPVTKQVTVLIGATTLAFSATTTMPSNITVIVHRGGSLQPAVSTTLTINGPLIAHTSTPTGGAGTVVHGSASYLTSPPTITNFTSGSVLLAGASGVLAQDNGKLFWETSNGGRFVVGNNTQAGGRVSIRNQDNTGRPLNGYELQASDYATNGGFLHIDKHTGAGGRATIESADDTGYRPIILNPTQGKIGINTGTTNTLSYDLTFGAAYRTIGAERAAAGIGGDLHFIASGAAVGSTNQNGGDIVLTPGTATGTGSGAILFQSVHPGASGTADSPALTDAVLYNGKLRVGDGNPATEALEVTSAGHTRMVVYGPSTANDVVTVWNDGTNSVQGGLMGATVSPGQFCIYRGACSLGIASTGAVTINTSIASPIHASAAADPADAGVIRLANDEAIAAEAAPAGTDGTLKYNSSEQWESNSPFALDGATPDANKAVITTADPTGTRTFTLPDANSNPVQPLTCGGTDKVSAISSAGVITCTADTGGAGSGDNLRVEDGDNTGTFTAMSDVDFDDSGDVDFARMVGPPDVLTATIRADAVALGGDTTGNYVQQVADGIGIDGAVTSEGGTYTPTLDLTEVNSTVFGDNSTATVNHTIDPSGVSNPVWSYSNGVANLSAGILQQGGSPVVTNSLTMTAGNGLSGGGDLSANRAFDVNVSGPIEISADSVACPTCTTASNSQSLTNKTFDSEGTGNVLLFPQRIEFTAAGCDGATAAAAFDLPSSAAASKSCQGTSPHRFGVLDFADGAALTANVRYLLPTDWTASGGVDIRYVWSSGSTSTNSVVWTIQTACSGDGEDVANPTYNSSQSVADANNSTVSTRNSASIGAVTMTGCTAGESLFIRIGRDPAHASDTLASTALLHSIEISIRRQI